ncbi:MAG: hypothetical protein AAGH65_12035 [Pseudomonadota bacterium]
MNVWLVVAFLGYLCWLLSELIEWSTGRFNVAVVMFTALFNLLLAVGVWAVIHRLAAKWDWWMKLTSLILSLSHLGLAVLPLHVVWSGDGLRFILGAYPIYLVFLLAWMLGMVVVSVLVIRARHIPGALGWALFVALGLLVVVRTLALPAAWIHLVSMLLCLLMIRITWLGLIAADARTGAVRNGSW